MMVATEQWRYTSKASASDPPLDIPVVLPALPQNLSDIIIGLALSAIYIPTD